MTNQELFDRVKEHLLTQRAKSGVPNSEYVVAAGGAEFCCFYRMPGTTLRCAIGCLIPDERYTGTLEFTPVTCSEVWNAAGIKYHIAGQIQLARDLQECHDNHEVRHWAVCLQWIAEEHALTY